MTDEKMAEESLISYKKEPKWVGKIFMQDENICYKDGFLAGLKAGKDMAEADLATVAYMQGADSQKKKAQKQLTKAKEIILKLYNAGRDVLMCRNEELAYTRLDNAINDKRIEQFLKEVSE